MDRYYVDIKGLSKDQLEFAGFFTVFEDDGFQLLSNKGDMYLIDKEKPYLYVDDKGDADFLRELRGRERITLPVEGSC
jgi:hypothetical protein